ncbi:hypothetical protein D3C72_1329340 [compost metagenome]
MLIDDRLVQEPEPGRDRDGPFAGLHVAGAAEQHVLGKHRRAGAGARDDEPALPKAVVHGPAGLGAGQDARQPFLAAAGHEQAGGVLDGFDVGRVVGGFARIHRQRDHLADAAIGEGRLVDVPVVLFVPFGRQAAGRGEDDDASLLAPRELADAPENDLVALALLGPADDDELPDLAHLVPRWPLERRCP